MGGWERHGMRLKRVVCHIHGGKAKEVATWLDAPLFRMLRAPKPQPRTNEAQEIDDLCDTRLTGWQHALLQSSRP